MMHLYRVAIRTILIATVCGLCLGTAEAAGIKVVAWNVEWFPGGRPDATAAEGQVRMAQAQAVLRKIAPDIFVAEELRDWQAFADLTAVVTNLRVHTVSAFRESDTGILAHQQVGIASRLHARAAWAETWQSSIPALPRGFSLAAVQDPRSGKLLLVYGVHLKSNRSNPGDARDAELNSLWRDESVSQLLDHVDEMERVTFKGEIEGIIVAGDFNTNSDGQFADRVVRTMVARGFRDTWSGVPREQRESWRGKGDFKPTTFDYIFTKGLPGTTAALIPIADGLSDHWPVTITLP